MRSAIADRAPTSWPRAAVGGIAGMRRYPVMFLLVGIVGAGETSAATRCDLPPVFSVVAEERGMVSGGRGVVVPEAESDAQAVSTHGPSELRAGDVIRQANGSRVDRCADLESAASEAFAKGVRLLLLVERDGAEVLAAPVRGAGSDGTTIARAPNRPATADGAVPASAAAPRRGSADETRTTGGSSGPKPVRRARVETTLPGRGDVSPETLTAATAALASLRTLDSAARLTAPLTLYERHLGDAERTVGALSFTDGPAAASVRAAIDEILAYHRTAHAIWRARLAYLSARGADRRALSGQPVPYFSDSPVPDWIGEYPFLQVTLVSTPRETRFLPGESSGSWDAERAMELLWARGHDATERLASWLGR